jgi:cytoskeleton protein RodZ
VQSSNHNNKGKEIVDEVSLGRLLKRTREERQIELDEAFRVTRIRRHALEALENERWDELPSQVFVKGFLKTYAEFLDLDKEMVFGLYERIPHPKGDKSEFTKESSPRTKWWPLALILVLFALAFIASIAVLNRSDISIVDKAFQNLDVQEPTGKVDEAAVRAETGGQAEGVRPEVLTRPKSDEKSDHSDVAGIAQQGKEKHPPPRFSLTANVRSRTWIAIYVDDQPVKEYLFQPRETFTWRAHKGFDILVGNAGGIDFILNGTEIGTLGDEGKVVRVKLPKNEE